MPQPKNNQLQPNLFFRNKHFNTLYRYFINNELISFTRERMQTSDADFIDLDISTVQSKKVIIAVHGLEGSSKSSYIQSLTYMANQQNYDVIAMNLRGCSGEPNLLISSYHSGKTADLLEVIQFVEQNYSYDEIHLIGYSLGGNLTLKLVGELENNYPSSIKSAVGISVPCDLKASAQTLNKGFNKLYQYGMLSSLIKKATYKLEQFPNLKINSDKVLRAKNFETYDEYFTSQLNGFIDADDYYKKSSCKQFITAIKIPSLLINAQDDSFLSESCYPYKEAENNSNFTFLTPKYGGHVGYYSSFDFETNFWLENQILSFIKKQEI